MARQVGPHAIEGTIGELVYYKNNHGYLVRRKGNLDKARVSKDPAFEGSRKASAEFGRAAVASRLMRQVLKECYPNVIDSSIHYRLNSLFLGIIKKDATNAPGERKIMVEHMEGLKTFEWIKDSPLSKVMWGKMSGSSDSEGNLTITMPGFSPKGDLNWPMAATHAEITAVGIVVDFEKATVNYKPAKSGMLAKVAGSGDIVLECGGAVTGDEIMIAGLGVAFYQEVSGQMTLLKEGTGFAVLGVGKKQ